MVGDILLAGYTLTAEEWEALEPEVRAELLDVAAGTVEIHPALLLDEIPRHAELLS